ncbi:15916_t:CDS:2, partial [Gigaspora margarita]
YPETSENGVACVYNVAGMDTEKALEIFDLKNIQYAYKGGTTRESVYCPFLNTKVYKETRTCRGIKICQFAAPELVAMTHTSVNFDDHLFKKIFEANELSLDLFYEHTYYNDSIIGEIPDSNRHCYTIYPLVQKQKCSYIHTTDNKEVAQGLIQKKSECPVKFWHYVPEDLKSCPYIVIMSRNIHNYPPPLPSKIPVAIQNDLRDIIAEEDILDLTARKLITRVPLPELHPSLNNRSKIEHIIATKRCAEHPYGQDIMGVAHMLLKQKQNNDDNPYIRSIHMSFKRVHGPINEWEVCAYVEKYQKTLVFARAFTILQTANTYQKLFEEVFTCVEQDCGHSVEFQHIHGRGIGCILADEHYGQAL